LAAAQRGKSREYDLEAQLFQNRITQEKKKLLKEVDLLERSGDLAARKRDWAAAIGAYEKTLK